MAGSDEFTPSTHLAHVYSNPGNVRYPFLFLTLFPPRSDRLSEAELDELLAQLVRSGDSAASALLIRRRGCSATEAHKLVEELDARV